MRWGELFNPTYNYDLSVIISFFIDKRSFKIDFKGFDFNGVKSTLSDDFLADFGFGVFVNTSNISRLSDY